MNFKKKVYGECGLGAFFMVLFCIPCVASQMQRFPYISSSLSAGTRIRIAGFPYESGSFYETTERTCIFYYCLLLPHVSFSNKL